MNSNSNSTDHHHHSAGSKLSKCIKAPIRALGKARDMYVKSMTGYADRVRTGGHTLPKSFSVNSSTSSSTGNIDDDLRALIRATSKRSQEGTSAAPGAASSNGLPKSFSVAIGRIDEDQPFDFEDDLKKVNSDAVNKYPRSRSHAVDKRKGVLG